MIRANYRLRVIALGMVLVLGIAASAFAQNDTLPLPPKEKPPQGIPNLSGSWLESPVRPTSEGNIQRAMGLDRNKPIEEAVPFTPLGLEQWKEKDLTKDPTGVCQPSGMARIFHSPLNMQILQTDGQVTFLFELYSQFTRVYMDGRTFPKDLFPTWWGYSIGHYEGNKLVVETRGLDERSWVASAGLKHSNKLIHTAAFELTGPDTLQITETFNDPVYFTKPWSYTYTRPRAKYDMILHVCTDNIRTLYDMMQGMFPDENQ